MLALILGALFGVLFAAAGIVYRWVTGTSTPVTPGGWPSGAITWASWGLLIGAVLALLEVVLGKRLAETLGLKVALSSLGSAIGSFAAWKVWLLLSTPNPQPATTTLQTK